MLTKLQAILVGFLTLIGIVIAVFFKGRASGKQEVQQEVVKEQTKAVEEVAQQRVDSVKVVKDVQQKVINSSDSAIDKELLDDWTRP